MQATLEAAIQAITGEQVTVTGSGRTDAGAHALGQVIAFSTASVLPSDTLRRALNATLPFDIAVTSASDAMPDFHPRHDARSRTYRYLIWNRSVRSPLWHGRAAHVKPRLDVRKMDAALRVLEGRHDLGAFIPAQTEGSRERTIYRARCFREGDLVIIDLEATGFMRQMVRTIAGTAIDIGRGALDVESFHRVLLSRNRTVAGETAPAHGLYLLSVNYDRSGGDERRESVIPPVALLEEK